MSNKEEFIIYVDSSKTPDEQSKDFIKLLQDDDYVKLVKHEE